jgi:hypothetical protein
MDLEVAALSGVTQGLGAGAVLLLYLDRRLNSIEATLKDLAGAIRGIPPRPPITPC